jgi:hypothetical protein
MESNSLEGQTELAITQYLAAGAAVVSERFLIELHRRQGLPPDLMATANTMCYHGAGKATFRHFLALS